MSPRLHATLARRWGVSLTLISSLLATSGGAQERVPESNGAGMDTHLFRPALDSKGFFTTNGADVLGHNDVSFGLVLDYGYGLLRTNQDREPSADPAVEPGRGVDWLVQHSFQGTLMFNYGIANLLVVGLSAPIVLMAADEAYRLGPSGGLYDSGKVDAQGIGHGALHAKLRLLRPDGALGLALLGQVGLPFGDMPRSMAADPGVWYWPRLAAEKRFGRTRRLKIGADVGYRGHTGDNPRFEQDAQGRSQLAAGTLEYANQATYGVGLAYRVLEPLDLIAETYGSYLLGGDSSSKQRHSQEVVAGMKLFVERNSYLMLGGGSRFAAANQGFEAADARLFLGFIFEPSIGDRDGDGIKDDLDRCPDEPEDFDGFKDADGCPDPDNDNDGILDVDDQCPNLAEDFDGDHDDDGCPEGSDGDRDGDGILDSLDKCPDEPEDRDGFQDADGCPDPDNDGDGIPDVRDKCPNEPETFNGLDDEDGCPDEGKVVIEGSDIVILEKVQFKRGSAEILPESDEILDAVTAALKGHPEFLVLEVAGHADERGNEDLNLRLTRARAAAVVDALVARGVQRSRLVSQGYGKYCPLDPAHTDAAWEKNRRVEFKIVKTEDGTTDAERGCELARQKGVLPPEIP